MTTGEKSLSFPMESDAPVKSSITEIYSFSDVVDKACEGLIDRQAKYSIRRIQEMEILLSSLEQELDDFLVKKERVKG